MRSQKRSKKVQKGPEAPKPIFSEGGWAYWDILGHIWDFLGFVLPKGILGTGGYFGYRRVFRVPEGIFLIFGFLDFWTFGT